MCKIFFIAIIMVIFFLPNSNLSMAYEKEIRSISSILAENIAKGGKKMIAVVDFTDLQGNVTELGRFLAEEFSVAFAGAGRGFEVVDRTHLKSILAEHKLSTTGIIDPQTARKLGQVAGVDALITGTITPFGDSIRLSIKILDTATAKVIGASSGDIAKTKAIEELLARGIELSQSSIQQTPTTSYIPPSSSPNSKKIGFLLVTIKKIVVSKGMASVFMEFANPIQDTEFRLGMDGNVGKPTLVDEKGNQFSYESDLSSLPFSYNSLNNPDNFKNFGFTLPPKSVNEMALTFLNNRNVDINELGNYFAVSLKYKLYNSKDKSVSHYNVSFTDIKAQMPK
jgi:TolB-like protein